MQLLKNIFVGFLVSFLGSIPLGYLNVVGFEIFQRVGLLSTLYYLGGVILIEFVVILSTLLFAKKLMKNKRLLKFIEGFSVFFMYVLAFVFYASSQSATSIALFDEIYLDTSPFVLGIYLSLFNFIQIPFWLSWNLYLLNGNHIEISNSRKYFYVFGTVAGTFMGMLSLILSLHFVANQTELLAAYLMKLILPIVFFGLGCLQGFKFYRKYSK